MADFFEALKAPTHDDAQTWFDQVADLLLNRSALRVSGRLHRLREIEFYYQGDEHVDPFAHGDPIQQTCARWYFHRDSGEYRGGSFKGLDITFGVEGTVGGILIRTIEELEGDTINGCSLCVDHLLKRTGFGAVAELDGALGQRHVWEESEHLQLVPAELEAQTVYATARVGLTLKRAFQLKEMPRYIMRPYRMLTDPSIPKGKLHTVIALHKAGHDAASIRALTRVGASHLTRYIALFDEGKAAADLKPFRGKALSTEDLCRVHGAWHALYEQPAA